MKKLLLAMTLIVLLSSCTQIDSYEITLQPGNDVIKKGETWIDSGCEVTINDDMYEMELTNTPDIETVGEYNLQYTYKYAGENFTCNRIVKVVDGDYPVVTLNPGLDSIYKGQTHIDAGVSVVDDQEEDCTIVVTNLVNINSYGSYTITYEVTDYDGNQTIVTRVVNVVHE